jgi:hypothetical protein
MKIIETHYLTDWKDVIRITFTIEAENEVFDFSVAEGDPEDIDFNRDFYNIHNIRKLIKLIYEASKHDEKLEYIIKQIKF